MINILFLILAFVLGFGTDYIWAMWAKTVMHGRPICAANLSILIFATGIFYTLIIVNYEVYAIMSYLLGAWLGTYISVKFNHKKGPK